MKQHVYALIDLDSAYCNMEAFWNPALVGKSIVVLSSNDGNIIARNAAAKALQIPMGVPIFQVQDIIQANDVQVLSSNFALYGEMSRRFHSIVSSIVGPDASYIYSIDEQFIKLTEFYKNYDLYSFAKEIRHQVYKLIGLPASIGCGQSLVEAKLANYIAKKNPAMQGVCDLVNMDLINKELFYQDIDVGEVWGIGSKYSKKLHAMNINTVLDLASSNPNRMRELFNVNIQSTILELQGIPCFAFEDVPKPKQQIVSSKSFGQKIKDLNTLQEAIAQYTQNAHARLRDGKQICGTMIVFLQSNPFDKSKPYFSKSLTYNFPEPTDNILLMVKVATLLIEHMFVPGIDYKKCGVFLCDLLPESKRVLDLLTDHSMMERDKELLETLESIQNRFGKSKIAVGSCRMKDRIWEPKSSQKSRNYFSEEGMIVFN